MVLPESELKCGVCRSADPAEGRRQTAARRSGHGQRVTTDNGWNEAFIPDRSLSPV